MKTPAHKGEKSTLRTALSLHKRGLVPLTPGGLKALKRGQYGTAYLLKPN
jgi:hypothetical protein